jgi:hypothetical protein
MTGPAPTHPLVLVTDATRFRVASVTKTGLGGGA